MTQDILLELAMTSSAPQGSSSIPQEQPVPLPGTEGQRSPPSSQNAGEANDEGSHRLDHLAASGLTAPTFYTIAASEYGDRQRLLYHITYLSTMLQRAQLQVEDLQQVVLILHDKVRQVAEEKEDDENGDGAAATPQVLEDAVRAVLHEGAVTTTAAAVSAAKKSQEVHEALHASLALFDPLIAQAQIHRLDDAIAKLSLLREAELQQLRAIEAEATELRGSHARLVEEVARLQTQCDSFDHQRRHQEDEIAAAKLEVARLRNEELHLNRRLAVAESLTADGTRMDGVQVVSGTALPVETSRKQQQLSLQRLSLQEQEAVERQTLLLDAFWDPMLIAFDAGITWLLETAALQMTTSASRCGAAAENPSPAASRTVEGAAEPQHHIISLSHQQELMSQLQGRLQILQERYRVGLLERERLQFLYEGEVRRSEMMAQDHAAQLQRAYDEVLHDRECIMNQLQHDVKEQIFHAFQDGRAYEQKHRTLKAGRDARVVRTKGAAQ